MSVSPALAPVGLFRALPRILLLLCLSAAVVAVVAPPARAGEWTVGEIVGPAGTTRVIPRAVNIHQVVVGTARFPGRTEDTAFRWEDGTMTELDLPGGLIATRANDINDDGVIVGWGLADKGACSYNPGIGVVWTATKTSSSASLTPFNTYLGGIAASGSDCTHGSYLYGINNDGTMVGRAGWKRESPKWGTARVDKPATTTGGSWSVLDLPDTFVEASGGSTYGGFAYAINDSGAILGNGGPSGDYGRLWNVPGAPYPLNDILPGPHGLNNLGHVVGRTGSRQARYWDGANYQTIGAGISNSEAYAINDSDWIVGRAGTNITNQLASATAYLWQPPTGSTPLYSLAPSGWSMYSALDINEDGMIVGTGKHGDDAVGYWMAPASIAHELSGTVRDAAGNPAAGVKVVVVNGGGATVATFTTGADGKYSGSVNRGSYRVRVDAAPVNFRPDGLAPCKEIVGDACGLALDQNRVVDFLGIDVVVPGGGDGGGSGGAGPAPGGGGGGGAPGVPFVAPGAPFVAPGNPFVGPPAPPAPPGPPITWPKGGKTATVSSKRKVSLKVGPVSAGVKGTLEVETKNTYKVKQSKSKQGKSKATASAARKRKKKAKTVKERIALGETTFTFKKASKNGKVTLKLSKSGAKFLKSKRSLKVVLKLTLVGTDGGTSTSERTIKLRAPKRSR